jgi:hypothetical protein
VTQEVSTSSKGEKKRTNAESPPSAPAPQHYEGTASTSNQADAEEKLPEIVSTISCGRPASTRWETAQKACETIYRALMVLLVAGGIVLGLPFLQLQLTKAQRDETTARAQIAVNDAAAKKILDIDLNAAQLGGPGTDRYILITLEIKNTGNRPLTVPAEKIRAYVAHVGDVDGQGQITYRNRQAFRFGDLPDSTLKQMDLSPSERTKYQTVQKIRDAGLYLIVVEISPILGTDSDQAFRATLFTRFD